LYSDIHIHNTYAYRSLQDVQIWFQPNQGASSSLFMPQSGSQDGFGESGKYTFIFLHMFQRPSLLNLQCYGKKLKYFTQIIV